MPSNFAFTGLFPAPSVPFNTQLDIAHDEFSSLVRTIGEARGVSGVLVNGHAGELAVLTAQERDRVIRTAREALQPGQQIMAGVDGLSVPDVIRSMKEALDSGADAALVLPPFDYNPRRKMTTSWEAPVRFYEAIASAVDLPIIIYQFPETSGSAYSTEALSRMADLDTVVGIKDTTLDGQLYQEHLEALQGRISILTALDTPDLLGHMLLGCDGAIIGVGQLGPANWGAYTDDILAGRSDAAIATFKEKLLPLVTHIFFGRFPSLASDAAKAKEALVQMGIFSTSLVRDPEVGVDDTDRENVREGLLRAGLLPTAAA